MTGRQDDTGPIPAPDSPADDLEQKRAERFGELVDSVVAGAKLPPAMDPDDRLHIDVASMIRASTSEVSLSRERARALADQALDRATSADRPPSISSLPAAGEDDELGTRRRSRLVRIAPWTVAAVAAAAAVVLWISRPPSGDPVARSDDDSSVVPRKLTTAQRSRPADPLIGTIERSDSHRASSRIDVIYADRLDGYRSLALSARAPRGARRD